MIEKKIKTGWCEPQGQWPRLLHVHGCFDPCLLSSSLQPPVLSPAPGECLKPVRRQHPWPTRPFLQVVREPPEIRHGSVLYALWEITRAGVRCHNGSWWDLECWGRWTWFIGD